MAIDCHLIPHLLGAYMGHTESEKCKNIFLASSLEATEPYPFTSKSYAFLFGINKRNNAQMLSNYTFGILLSKNSIIVQSL